MSRSNGGLIHVGFPVQVRRRRLLTAGLAATALTLASPLAVRSVTEEEIRAAQKERERLADEARDAEAILLAAHARESTLQQQLAAIDRDRYAAVDRLRVVQREMETIELEVYDINQSIGRLNSSLGRETNRLEDRVRSLYKLGARRHARDRPLGQLVRGCLGSRGDGAARAQTRRCGHRSDTGSAGTRFSCARPTCPAAWAEWSCCGRRPRRSKEQLAERAAEQRDLIFGVQREQADVEDQISAFEAESAVIGRQIAVLRDIRERELAQLEQRRRIAELQRQAREFARNVAAEQGSSEAGPYVWPLIGLITTEFGGCTFGQCPHIGIDVAGSLGAPIVAANDGVVLAAGLVVPGNRQASYGLIVVIAHTDTEETLYAHLDDYTWPPTVAPGQFVARGQTIGYVGLTGWTTGPHLHFEYRVNGGPVNPRQVLL